MIGAYTFAVNVVSESSERWPQKASKDLLWSDVGTRISSRFVEHRTYLCSVSRVSLSLVSCIVDRVSCIVYTRQCVGASVIGPVVLPEFQTHRSLNSRLRRYLVVEQRLIAVVAHKHVICGARAIVSPI